ncbi:triose-phosphate isomerase [Candidatus Kaiserbacteria bacterium]|nr:triose-phosphate isomerase [Candidatus Kaiserbacteria bacterium]
MKKTTSLIVGNWKLNPTSLTEAVTLSSAVARKNKQLNEVAVAIAPPYPYLSDVKKKIAKSSVALAAQDVSTENMGAFTGEVSIIQLKDLGVEYVIIGHSERRAMGETDELIQRKVAITLKHRLIPIVCVGERDRDDQGNFFSFVEDQLRSLASTLSSAEIKKVVIAYEPIWAIGTGNTATVEDVKEMQLFIESTLTKLYDRATAKRVRLLYGGSVKPANARLLSVEGGMNGFLVGGSSLKADDFTAIIKAAI